MAEQEIPNEPVQKEAEQPADAGYGEEEQLYDNMGIDAAPAQVECPENVPYIIIIEGAPA